MDLQQMIAFHLERDADVTVATLPVPSEEGSSFGVISIVPRGPTRFLARDSRSSGIGYTE